MRYFDIVEGSELDSQRTDKAELLSYVLEKWNLKADECIMIGDRKHDILGAKANGMDSIAVGYGYGSEDELSKAGPTHFFSTIEEVKNFFLNWYIQSVFLIEIPTRKWYSNNIILNT